MLPKFKKLDNFRAKLSFRQFLLSHLGGGLTGPPLLSPLSNQPSLLPPPPFRWEEERWWWCPLEEWVALLILLLAFFAMVAYRFLKIVKYAYPAFSLFGTSFYCCYRR